MRQAQISAKIICRQATEGVVILTFCPLRPKVASGSYEWAVLGHDQCHTLDFVQKSVIEISVLTDGYRWYLKDLTCPIPWVTKPVIDFARADMSRLGTVTPASLRNPVGRFPYIRATNPFMWTTFQANNEVFNGGLHPHRTFYRIKLTAIHHRWIMYHNYDSWVKIN